jgi:hypothetical protein
MESESLLGDVKGWGIGDEENKVQQTTRINNSRNGETDNRIMQRQGMGQRAGM